MSAHSSTVLHMHAVKTLCTVPHAARARRNVVRRGILHWSVRFFGCRLRGCLVKSYCGASCAV